MKYIIENITPILIEFAAGLILSVVINSVENIITKIAILKHQQEEQK